MQKLRIKDKIYYFIILAVVCMYAIPFGLSYDLFPFSNYPMYATFSYRDLSFPVLCKIDQDQNRANLPLLAADMFRTQFYFLKLYPEQSAQYFQDMYIKEYEKKYSSKIKIKFYSLNINKYKKLVLEGVSQDEIYAIPEFNVCN